MAETPETTIQSGWMQSTLRYPSGKLLVERGPDAGRFALLEGERMVIGRAAGSNLLLSDPMVSALHAELLATSDGPLLRDLGSTNGVWLCGHRVDRVLLGEGSLVALGQTELRFVPLEEQVEIAVSALDELDTIYGRSLAMRRIFARLERVAGRDLTLLLTGETGTGKEMVARSVHNLSLRSDQPFLVLDCGSLTRELVESTLFGHERGAFTGAVAERRGIFEEAAGGTVFLDEIGDMDLDLQRRLLRVLESRQVTRLGSHRPIAVDVRIIAATNKDLRELINRGAFRADLYFRLAQVQLELPPLRARREDIEGLAQRMLVDCATWLEGAPRTLAPDAVRALLSHDWPGNARELRNVIQRAAALARGPALTAADLELRPPREPAPLSGIDLELPFKEAKARVVEAFERAYLAALMRQHRGNLTHAARTAQLARNHLRALLRERGVIYEEKE